MAMHPHVKDGSLKAITPLIDEMAKDITKVFHRTANAISRLPEVTPDTVERLVDRYHEQFEKTLRVHIGIITLKGVDIGYDVLDYEYRKELRRAAIKETPTFDVDWKMVNKRAVDWARTHVGEEIVKIDHVTRTAIRNTVAEWVESGDPMPKLVRKLSDTKNFSNNLLPLGRKRAKLIATTEATSAYAEGNLIAWQSKQDIIESLQWRTANDERVCPICAPLGGLEWKEESPETTDQDAQQAEGILSNVQQPNFVHPGGTGKAANYVGRGYKKPPAHPGCRCWMVPKVKVQAVQVKFPKQTRRTRAIPKKAKRPLIPKINTKQYGRQVRESINMTDEQLDRTLTAMTGTDDYKGAIKRSLDDTSAYVPMTDDAIQDAINTGKIKSGADKAGRVKEEAVDRFNTTEKRIFGMTDDAVEHPDEMPKYGILSGADELDATDIPDMTMGVNYIKLKPETKNRSTVTLGDSKDRNRKCGLVTQIIRRAAKAVDSGFTCDDDTAPAVPLSDPDETLLFGYVKRQTGQNNEKISLKTFGESENYQDLAIHADFLEAQIFGGLDLNHIDTIYVESKKFGKFVEDLLKAKGYTGITVKPSPMHSKLLKLWETGDDPDILGLEVAKFGDEYIDRLHETILPKLLDWNIPQIDYIFRMKHMLKWMDDVDPVVVASPLEATKEAFETVMKNMTMKQKRSFVKDWIVQRTKSDGGIPTQFQVTIDPINKGWIWDIADQTLLKKTPDKWTVQSIPSPAALKPINEQLDDILAQESGPFNTIKPDDFWLKDADGVMVMPSNVIHHIFKLEAEEIFKWDDSFTYKKKFFGKKTMDQLLKVPVYTKRQKLQKYYEARANPKPGAIPEEFTSDYLKVPVAVEPTPVTPPAAQVVDDVVEEVVDEIDPTPVSVPTVSDNLVTYDELTAEHLGKILATTDPTITLSDIDNLTDEVIDLLVDVRVAALQYNPNLDLMKNIVTQEYVPVNLLKDMPINDKRAFLKKWIYQSELPDDISALPSNFLTQVDIKGKGLTDDILEAKQPAPAPAAAETVEEVVEEVVEPPPAPAIKPIEEQLDDIMAQQEGTFHTISPDDIWKVGEDGKMVMPANVIHHVFKREAEEMYFKWTEDTYSYKKKFFGKKNLEELLKVPVFTKRQKLEKLYKKKLDHKPGEIPDEISAPYLKPQAAPDAPEAPPAQVVDDVVEEVEPTPTTAPDAPDSIPVTPLEEIDDVPFQKLSLSDLNEEQMDLLHAIQPKVTLKDVDNLADDVINDMADLRIKILKNPDLTELEEYRELIKNDFLFGKLYDDFEGSGMGVKRLFLKDWIKESAKGADSKLSAALKTDIDIKVKGFTDDLIESVQPAPATAPTPDVEDVQAIYVENFQDLAEGDKLAIGAQHPAVTLSDIDHMGDQIIDMMVHSRIGHMNDDWENFIDYLENVLGPKYGPPSAIQGGSQATKRAFLKDWIEESGKGADSKFKPIYRTEIDIQGDGIAVKYAPTPDTPTVATTDPYQKIKLEDVETDDAVKIFLDSQDLTLEDLKHFDDDTIYFMVKERVHHLKTKEGLNQFKEHLMIKYAMGDLEEMKTAHKSIQKEFLQDWIEESSKPVHETMLTTAYLNLKGIDEINQPGFMAKYVTQADEVPTAPPAPAQYDDAPEIWAKKFDDLDDGDKEALSVFEPSITLDDIDHLGEDIIDKMVDDRVDKLWKPQFVIYKQSLTEKPYWPGSFEKLEDIKKADIESKKQFLKDWIEESAKGDEAKFVDQFLTEIDIHDKTQGITWKFKPDVSEPQIIWNTLDDVPDDLKELEITLADIDHFGEGLVADLVGFKVDSIKLYGSELSTYKNLVLTKYGLGTVDDLQTMTTASQKRFLKDWIKESGKGSDSKLPPDLLSEVDVHGPGVIAKYTDEVTPSAPTPTPEPELPVLNKDDITVELFEKLEDVFEPTITVDDIDMLHEDIIAHLVSKRVEIMKSDAMIDEFAEFTAEMKAKYNLVKIDDIFLWGSNDTQKAFLKDWIKESAKGADSKIPSQYKPAPSVDVEGKPLLHEYIEQAEVSDVTPTTAPPAPATQVVPETFEQFTTYSTAETVTETIPIKKLKDQTPAEVAETIDKIKNHKISDGTINYLHADDVDELNAAGIHHIFEIELKAMNQPLYYDDVFKAKTKFMGRYELWNIPGIQVAQKRQKLKKWYQKKENPKPDEFPEGFTDDYLKPITAEVTTEPVPILKPIEDQVDAIMAKKSGSFFSISEGDVTKLHPSVRKHVFELEVKEIYSSKYDTAVSNGQFKFRTALINKGYETVEDLLNTNTQYQTNFLKRWYKLRANPKPNWLPKEFTDGFLDPVKLATKVEGPTAVPVIEPKKDWTGVDNAWNEKQTNSDFFTYKGVSRRGGAHEKWDFEDPDGNEWMFKPIKRRGEEFRADGDEMAYKIGRLIDEESIEVRVYEYNGTRGSMQKIQTGLHSQADYRNLRMQDLAPDEIEELQREHVIDWLISNHDSHTENFLRGTNGHVYGIDKGQTFKHLGSDRLSIDYHPNGRYGAGEPVYNTLMRLVKRGEIQIDPNATLRAIKKVERISDDEYMDLLKVYADGRFGRRRAEKEAFYEMALNRKNNIRKDFEEFYADILDKPDFKFVDETIEAVQETVVQGVGIESLTEDVINDVAENLDELGVQGKVIPYDKADIEDQNVLAFTDVNNGQKRTILKFKLRKEAEDKVMEVVRRSGVVQQTARVGDPMVEDVFAHDILQAVKTVNHHVVDGEFNQATLNQAYAHVNKLEDYLTSTDQDLQEMSRTYILWLDKIRESVSARTRIDQRFNQYKRQFLPRVERQEELPFEVSKGPLTGTRREVRRGEGIVQEDRTSVASIINNGYGEGRTVGEQYDFDFGNGIRASFKPTNATNDRYFAMNGDFEIFIDGVADAKDIDRALKQLEKLNIDVGIPDAIDAELLYLHKQAYLAKLEYDNDYQTRLRRMDNANMSKEERVAELRKYWNERLGVEDVTKLPDYKPYGEYQRSFQRNGRLDAGYREHMRFDISDEAMEREMKGYGLKHEITNNNGSVLNFLKQVFENNGAIISTTEKMRIGVPVGGMSPGADIGTGGGTYIFTRIAKLPTARSRSVGLFFDKRLLRRQDGISYNHDAFGRVRDGFVSQNRGSTPAEWKDYSRRAGNETIFKNSIMLRDYLNNIVCHAYERDEILDLLRANGITHFRNGKSIEDAVIGR